MDLPYEKATSVRVIRPYVIDVAFVDGHRREVDIEPLLWGEVFAPLRDLDLFRQAAVNPDSGSVCWPTGADLAPEFLYYGEEGPPAGYYEPREEPVEATSAPADRRCARGGRAGP